MEKNYILRKFLIFLKINLNEVDRNKNKNKGEKNEEIYFNTNNFGTFYFY